jgi:hypothetical protein
MISIEYASNNPIFSCYQIAKSPASSESCANHMSTLPVSDVPPVLPYLVMYLYSTMTDSLVYSLYETTRTVMWMTLSQLVLSTPSAGKIPIRMDHTKTVSLSISMYSKIPFNFERDFF